jgi:PAS domain S-box-containing protein
MVSVAFRLHGRIDRPWRFLAIAIVLVIVVLFYADWRRYNYATTQSDQTRLFIAQTNLLLSSVKDAETGQRGYLLTGDRKYLAPYEKAAALLSNRLDDLTRTATTTRREINQVALIRSLVNTKMAELKHTIEVRDLEGDEAAMAFLRSGDGTLAMDEVRTNCALLVSFEQARLFDLEKQVASNANRSRYVVLAGCVGLVFLLFQLGTAVDTVVAERERFARNVEDSRQLLETTLASIGDAVIVTDESGAIRSMNPVAERLTGWRAETAAKKPLDEVFHLINEGTREPVLNPFRALEHEAVVQRVGEQSVLVARDGRDVPIEDSSAPIRNGAKDVLGVVLVFRDVTARRIAERELERWKKIFAGAGFGMFVIEPESSKIVDVNPTFAAMHGYSVNELLGVPLSVLLPSQSRARLAVELRTTNEKGRHMFEQQHVRRDGTEFPGLIDLTTFQNGKQEFWAGYCSDISERKKFEDSLRESEERFRTLASALPQLVWSTDATGKIEYVNEVWIAYAGWNSGDEARKYLPQEPWSDLIHPEDRENYLQKWNHSLQTGNIFEAQVRLRRASNGGYRWFLCRGVAVRDRAGRIVRWLGGCTDVQQQMEDAAQLKLANQALRQSNDDLEQFAYAASHDLQEPLRMVSIYSQLLKEEYGNELDGQALSYIEFAVNGATRMSNLLRALLAYSRVANAAPQASEKADACSAVAAALMNLSATIESSGARIDVSALPMVRIPEIHLVQLFQNLIGNGLKYSKEEYPPGEGPEIRIAATRRPDTTWLFSVRDNGIGIESEYLTQIFGIFKRLHGAGFEGTGIGLALCQKIVERAGGRIWAESEPGAGSTFFFTLPGVDTGDNTRAYYNSAG